MSSATTLSKEKSLVFQTILSSPGMSEKCKIILMLSRQNILFLCRLIEAGLLADKSSFNDEIIAALPDESLEEFKALHGDILAKGELTQFYEKLKLL